VQEEAQKNGLEYTGGSVGLSQHHNASS